MHYLPLAIVRLVHSYQNLKFLKLLTLYTKNQASYLVKSLLSLRTIMPGQSLFIPPSNESQSNFSYAAKYTSPSSGPSQEELQTPLEFLSHFRPTYMLGVEQQSAIQKDTFPPWDLYLTQFWFQASIWNNILEAGKYRESEKLLKGVMKKQKQLLGDNHPDTLSTMGSLSKTYFALREYQKPQNSIYCAGETETAPSLAYLAIREYRKAEELNVIVLEKRKQLLGDSHPHTLCTMDNLASTYSGMGEHQKAKELILLGDNHPDTLCTMRNLAWAYSAITNAYSGLRKHRKAKNSVLLCWRNRNSFWVTAIYTPCLPWVVWLGHTQSWESIKSQRTRCYCAGETETASGRQSSTHPACHSNLANTYSALGEHQKAEELNAIIVLGKQQQLPGNSHAHTLHSIGNLASTYSGMGEHQMAKVLCVIVLEKQKQLLGDKHPHTLRTMGNLASTYSGMGEHQKAKELCVIVLEKQKQLLGDKHPHTLRTMGNLASTYSGMGEHQKAKELCVIVLEKQKQLLGDKHPDTLCTMGGLAATYSGLGEHQKAKELCVIVLEKQKQLLGDNHLHTLLTMGNLAGTYSGLGEHQKAEELNVIVLEKRKQLLGDHHPHTLHAMGNLANTYSALGEYQKAKELNVIVLEKRKQLLGDNHPDTLRTMGNLAIIQRTLRNC
ncbi:hypothetical protein B0H13DRAFT_2501573 [Mycena leptocephala]|nr:hypothetical protein B0H13DRAFT_2501573 [Mycena leptocephala]